MKQITRYLLVTLLFTGCASPEKIAQRKAAKAAADRLAKIELYNQVRKEYPCDSSTIIVTNTDTAYVANTDTTYSDTGRIIYRDRIITHTITKQVTVVDSLALHTVWLNLQQAGYLLENCQDASNNLADELKGKDSIIKAQAEQIAALKPWKRYILVSLGLLAAGGLVWGILKLKSLFL